MVKISLAVVGLDYGLHPLLGSDGSILHQGNIEGVPSPSAQAVSVFWARYGAQILSDVEKDKLPTRYRDIGTMNNPVFKVRVYADKYFESLYWTKPKEVKKEPEESALEKQILPLLPTEAEVSKFVNGYFRFDCDSDVQEEAFKDGAEWVLNTLKYKLKGLRDEFNK